MLVILRGNAHECSYVMYIRHCKLDFCGLFRSQLYGQIKDRPLTWHPIRQSFFCIRHMICVTEGLCYCYQDDLVRITSLVADEKKQARFCEWTSHEVCFSDYRSSLITL
jgi:hypothetical protein